MSNSEATFTVEQVTADVRVARFLCTVRSGADARRCTR